MSTKVPSIPAPTAANLLQVSQALKGVLDVREGLLGDPLDANVTYRDLIDAGALVRNPSFSGGGGRPAFPAWAEPDGYDPTQDFTTPPAPANFTATGLFASVQLQWNSPAYRNHSYTEIWRAQTNAIGDAILIGTSDTRFYVDQLGASATKYYWVRFVSQANVTGPYNAVDGSAATTAIDPELVLASLSGQIRESHLYSGLSSRIDLVDAPSSVPNSVNARVAFVQGQVNDLLNIPAWNSALSYVIDDQVTYGGSLYRAIASSTNVLPTNTSYWQKIGDYTTLGDAVAAHTTQINDLQGGLGQEVVDRQALAVQMRGNYTGNDLSLVSQGLIFQERTARATAVSALSSEFTTLSALVNTKTKVYYQSTAPTNIPAGKLVIGDLWIDTNVTYYNDYSEGDYVIRSNKQYRWSGTAWEEAIDYGFADWFSAINTEKTARVDADSALATQITSLTSLVGGNSSAIQQEITTRANADSALSTSITSLSSQVNNATTGLPATRALLLSDYYTKAGTDSAISSATSTLVSQTALNTALGSYTTTALLQQNYYTRTQTDSAISSATTALQSTVNNQLTGYATTAALQAEANTRASVDGSLLAQYTVKTDLAGRVAGFGLASQTNTAGVNTSSFAVIADRFSISAPNDYTQESTPTSGVVAGKVWYKPSTNQTQRYDGSQWVAFNPIAPFVVQATPTTINGVSVPAGVYMDAAFIRDGTITNAKIANAAIDNAKIANLDASKITTGFLDADLIQAQSITADKIGAGEIAAAGSITVGGAGASAPLVLTSSGEVISNGPSGDKARFYSGNVEIYKQVPGVGSVVYKALSRAEFGQADNNTAVTIPGYFKSQPKIIVSPASLQLYSVAYSNQSQSIQCQAINITETSYGSMVWQFLPVATLNLAASTGLTAVNQASGVTSASWTSSQYVTPANATSITASVTLSSNRGTGQSGVFYYRTVRARLEYLSGGSWVAGAWQSVNLGADASASVVVNPSLALPGPGVWTVRVMAEAFDTNGSTFGSVAYETATDTATRTGDAFVSVEAFETATRTLNYTPTYSPPSGWSIVSVSYSYVYSYYAYKDSGVGNQDAAISGSGLYIRPNYGQTLQGNNTTGTRTQSNNSLTFSVFASYDSFFQRGGVARLTLHSANATITRRRPAPASTTAANSFAFNSYSYSLSSAQVLATGSLNWVAIGD